MKLTNSLHIFFSRIVVKCLVMALVTLNKQLLDEVFVICRSINVEVKVISRAKGEADNSYRDIDNLAYHKNRSNNCFIMHFKWRKP